MKKRILIGITLFALLVLCLATGFILLWRLFLLSVLLVLVSYVWTALSIRGISSQVRQLPKRCQAGDSFTAQFILTNQSRVPKLLLKVREKTSLPGHTSVRTVSMAPVSSFFWQTEVHCPRRGQYHLGALNVVASDPFGLFSRCRDLGEPNQILVCPATAELPYFELSLRYSAKYGTGVWLGDRMSPNASSVREYRTGDSLKHIHWRSTARTSKLLVKVFDPDLYSNATKNIWVIPDMYGADHVGNSDESTEEYGVTIAASLLKKYLESGSPVGMIASGDQLYRFPPGTGEAHLWQILTALALMKATGTTPLDQLISEALETFGVDSALIVITPSSSERLAATLRSVRSRVGMIVAILVDAGSFGGTADVTNLFRLLAAGGIQSHLVRRGDRLAKALDCRGISARVSYVREVHTVY